ncbi:MAG: hypothetical protein HQK49_17330 [Oligoflexia bacterium]|nr:hypothetical protein [Oligoflexia bacterium]
MKFLWMFTSEIKYGLIMQKRYLFDILAGIVNILLFVIFIQLGIHSLQGDISSAALGTKLSSVIIGFFTFIVISSGIMLVANNITEGATTGTLEQTMLTPFGAEYVLLSRTIVGSVVNLLICLILIPISMLICRHWFSIDIGMLFVLLVPLWLSCWGVGFILGAFALIFKRVQSFMNLTQFLILSLMVVPSYPFNLYSLLPISSEATTMNRVLAVGNSVTSEWVLFLYLHGLIYLILGILIFKLGERYACNKGILGQY